jgi:2-polyprenyl-6-methoxyphenol hydroxylase-like FAD-dependent oxidoreductase
MVYDYDEWMDIIDRNYPELHQKFPVSETSQHTLKVPVHGQSISVDRVLAHYSEDQPLSISNPTGQYLCMSQHVVVLFSLFVTTNHLFAQPICATDSDALKKLDDKLLDQMVSEAENRYIVGAMNWFPTPQRIRKEYRKGRQSNRSSKSLNRFAWNRYRNYEDQSSL